MGCCTTTPVEHKPVNTENRHLSQRLPTKREGTETIQGSRTYNDEKNNNITDDDQRHSSTQSESKEADEDKKENEDWQIMGDILFSIRHSLICRMRGIEDDDGNNNDNKRKPHLDTKQNEWQTFFFEEYGESLFTVLRGKWLNSPIISDKYVKKLFGEISETLPVEQLDINKSCKYYWRRLNTNSKSGQIFFQTVNGEYIIKSMPKSEAEFFRKNFLEKYYKYMLSQSDSLLMHIMGFYKIQYKKIEGEQKKLNLASNNEYNTKRKQDINKGIYVIVMKSILFCEMIPTVRMHKIYDLKGSTHNRTASRYKLELDKLTFDALNEIDDKSFEQQINNVDNVNDNVKRISNSYSVGLYQPKNTENVSKFKKDKGDNRRCITVYKRSKVLKDLDFMQDEEIIDVGEKIKNEYLIQLRSDLDFLIKMNVMDYSLLVGIHRLDINQQSHHGPHSNVKPKRIITGNLFTFEFGGMCNEKIMFNNNPQIDKKNIYFTGIIDFLQQYNSKKKMESYYKRVKVSNGKDAISSVDSKTYANRLYHFIAQRIK